MTLDLPWLLERECPMMDGEVCWFTPDVHVVVIPNLLALMKEG